MLTIDENSGAGAERLAARLQNDIERQNPLPVSGAVAGEADFVEAVSAVMCEPPFDPAAYGKKGWWERTFGARKEVPLGPPAPTEASTDSN